MTGPKTGGRSVDSNHPATLATVQNYWPTGAIQKMTYGNGLTGTRAYDNRLQPCRVNVNSSATALQSCSGAIPSGNVMDLNAGFNYGSGDNGNVVSWAAAGQQSFSRSYTYDSLNRLWTMSAPSDPSLCYGLKWNYDGWGNRTAQNTTSGSCLNPQTPVDGNNHLLNPPYTYDLAGNLTNDGTHQYTYDAEERLSTVTNGGTSYLYNADGMRVSKTVGSASTDFIRGYDGTVLSENIGPVGAIGRTPISTWAGSWWRSTQAAQAGRPSLCTRITWARLGW
jgi:YD repeat-containing protein